MFGRQRKGVPAGLTPFLLKGGNFLWISDNIGV